MKIKQRLARNLSPSRSGSKVQVVARICDVFYWCYFRVLRSWVLTWFPTRSLILRRIPLDGCVLLCFVCFENHTLSQEKFIVKIWQVACNNSCNGNLFPSFHSICIIMPCWRKRTFGGGRNYIDRGCEPCPEISQKQLRSHGLRHWKPFDHSF